jgi:pimeloyl-ACP methyl ester carboxylesterase
VAGHRGGLLTDVAGRRRDPAGPGGGGPGVDTPSVQSLPGHDGTRLAYADRRPVAELRPDEPWFPGAYAAFGRIRSGGATDDDWTAIPPFTHGRWDDAARAAAARADARRDGGAAARHHGDGSPDPAAVRAALAERRTPVLLVAGELDVALPPSRAAEHAGLLPGGRLVVQPGAGHSPWQDDPAAFVRVVVGSSTADGRADTGRR